MISADNFTELTQNKNLTSDNIQGLKELVDKYPYFQAARVLYLKSLLDTESGEYKTEVTTNAPLVPSRRHLFNFLYSESAGDVEVAKAPIQSTVKEPKKKKSPGRPKKSKPASTIQFADESAKTDLTIEAKPGPSTDDDILELIDGDADSIILNDSKNGEDLIDQFITNPPDIPRPTMPPRGEKVEIEDKSVSSVIESEELASETLAEIYVAQGYYDKAIKVYSKLSLKYPEKSSYFADQIRIVEEKLNSKH